MDQSTVLIVTSNPQDRSALVKIIDAEPYFSIVAHARNLTETYALSEQRTPHVVILDVAFTIQPEFEVVRSFFAANDIRWLTFGVGPKQSLGNRTKADIFCVDIHASPAALRSQLSAIARSMRAVPAATVTRHIPQKSSNYRRLAMVGASTGGVEALIKVIGQFPEICPPTLIVQHTGRSFAESLVTLLAKNCRAEVILAQDGLDIKSGRIVVAAGGTTHLRIGAGRPLRTKCQAGPLVSGHLPSVDALFHSATSIASQVVGVLLTGMGRDGAEGLLALRQAGATTIAQDEKSSVVFGMPRAAAEIGAVEHQLPLSRIGSAILEHCSVGTKRINAA